MLELDMKTFLIVAAIAGLALIGYRYLPADLKAKTGEFAAAIGLTRFSPANLLPPLKSKAAETAHELIPENPVEKRAALIQKLEKNLKTIAKAPAAQNPKDQAAVESALKESEKLVAELKEENPRSGLLATFTERIVNTVLPASSETKTGDTKTVCVIQ